jgi:hypothetical protein
MSAIIEKPGEYSIKYTSADSDPVFFIAERTDEQLKFTTERSPLSEETPDASLLKTLEFAGPQVKAYFDPLGSVHLESVDARSVSKGFDLTLDSTPGGVGERRIQGAEEAPNSIYLRNDESARNAVRTGDKDDTIFMGPKGGTVDAGKGSNLIACGDGIDEIIIKDGYSGFLNRLTSQTTVQNFKPGQDKIKLDVQNNGWVSSDEQAKIDALPRMLSLPLQYEAAKKVTGVDKGEVFILQHGQRSYLAVDDGEGDGSTATIIGLDARPLPTDVILAG